MKNPKISINFTRTACSLAALGAGLFCVVGTSAAQDQARQAMRFEQALAAALASHPAVRAADQRTKQAESEVDAAKSGYKPQIRGGLENQLSLRQNSSYDSRSVYTATASGSQMLYDFGKVAGQVSKARAQAEANHAALSLTADDIGLATAQAWIDVHMHKALVVLAQGQYASMASIADLVADRVAKGATSRSDLAQAQSRLNSVRSMQVAAEAEDRRARLMLMHLTGRASPVDIDGEIPAILSATACRVDDVSASQKIQMAAAERDAAKTDYAIAKAEGMPTVSLEGDVGYALTKGSRLYGDYRTTGQIGVTVSMPFYQGGGTKARTQSARHSWQSAEEAVQQSTLEQRQAMSAAMAQYDGWQARAPILQERVQNIDTARALYRQQYLHLGTRTLIDLLNSEQEYHSAQVDVVQGVHSQYRLAAECLYVAGVLRASMVPDAAEPRYGPSDQGGI